jgi:hypothetical protein
MRATPLASDALKQRNQKHTRIRAISSHWQIETLTIPLPWGLVPQVAEEERSVTILGLISFGMMLGVDLISFGIKPTISTAIFAHVQLVCAIRVWIASILWLQCMAMN